MSTPSFPTPSDHQQSAVDSYRSREHEYMKQKSFERSKAIAEAKERPLVPVEQRPEHYLQSAMAFGTVDPSTVPQHSGVVSHPAVSSSAGAGGPDGGSYQGRDGGYQDGGGDDDQYSGGRRWSVTSRSSSILGTPPTRSKPIQDPETRYMKQFSELGSNPRQENAAIDFLAHPDIREPGKRMETREAHNMKYHQAALDGPSTEGFMARWESLPEKKQSSKMILSHYPQAIPEIVEWNYLKPGNYGAPEDNQKLNYHPTSDMRQTRFHKGFQRRHHTDIRQDAARLQKEYELQCAHDNRDAKVQQGWSNYKNDCQFNVLNGEGAGRDHEFKSIGKRIVNPTHNHSIYEEHDREQRLRTKQGAHRFYENPRPDPSGYRSAQLASEGFLESKKETMIIGYGNGAPRTKLWSQGVNDQFAHLKDGTKETQWEKSKDRNASQIVFG